MLSQFVFLLKIKNQMSFYPFILRKISVLTELILGHLRYYLTDVPPQPNSQPDNVKREGHHTLIKEKVYKSRNKYTINILFLFNSVSKISFKVVVFQVRIDKILPLMLHQ